MYCVVDVVVVVLGVEVVDDVEVGMVTVVLDVDVNSILVMLAAVVGGGCAAGQPMPNGPGAPVTPSAQQPNGEKHSLA